MSWRSLLSPISPTESGHAPVPIRIQVPSASPSPPDSPQSRQSHPRASAANHPHQLRCQTVSQFYQQPAPPSSFASAQPHPSPLPAFSNYLPKHTAAPNILALFDLIVIPPPFSFCLPTTRLFPFPTLLRNPPPFLIGFPFNGPRSICPCFSEPQYSFSNSF